MIHCANSFIDIDHPHFICAHLGKIDIAVGAHINTKQISFSSSTHRLQATAYSSSCLPACHAHTLGHTQTLLLPGRVELPKICFNLPSDIPEKPWQPYKVKGERVWCVYLPLRVSSAHQPHTVCLTAPALAGATPHLSGAEQGQACMATISSSFVALWDP